MNRKGATAFGTEYSDGKLVAAFRSMSGSARTTTVCDFGGVGVVFLMSESEKLPDQIPVDPSQPDTKINLVMVGAIVVVGVSEDPPVTVEEATEAAP